MVRFVAFVAVNYVMLLVHMVLLVYGAKQLFHVRLKKSGLLNNCFIPCLILTLLITSISFIDLWHQSYITPFWSLVMSIVQYAGLFVWLKHYAQVKHCAIPLILITLFNCIDTITTMTLQYVYMITEDFSIGILPMHYLFYIATVIIACFIKLLLIRFLSYRGDLNHLLKFPKLVYFLLLYAFAEQLIFNGTLDYSRDIDTTFINLYASAIFLFLLLLFIVIVREVDRNYQLSYSKSMLVQQQKYVEHVEALYNDLQKLHHDHKNLLSGMYFQVSEGKIDEVKAYLSEKLLTTDEQLQENIRQQKQLNNVKMLEVKSLLFTKILMANAYNVTLNLEVLLPIESLSMEMNDFLRVLGIAIDNAIEAASKLDNQAVVDVLMLQSEHSVEVIVKNPCPETVNLERIWELGYSTKGENRGIGLATYKEILNSYANVLRETHVLQDQFVQTIVIPR